MFDHTFYFLVPYFEINEANLTRSLNKFISDVLVKDTGTLTYYASPKLHILYTLIRPYAILLGKYKERISSVAVVTRFSLDLRKSSNPVLKIFSFS